MQKSESREGCQNGTHIQRAVYRGVEREVAQVRQRCQRQRKNIPRGVFEAQAKRVQVGEAHEG